MKEVSDPVEAVRLAVRAMPKQPTAARTAPAPAARATRPREIVIPAGMKVCDRCGGLGYV